MRPQTKLAILTASGEPQTFKPIRFRVRRMNFCQSDNFTE